ncbi:MAG TPA: hypothetical protein VMS08_04800 [Candidatus Saccharimonadia bacterium]|nr:hypothetical protein [Candidatus Saccharimonadia bacterium]
MTGHGTTGTSGQSIAVLRACTQIAAQYPNIDNKRGFVRELDALSTEVFAQTGTIGISSAQLDQLTEEPLFQGDPEQIRRSLAALRSLAITGLWTRELTDGDGGSVQVRTLIGQVQSSLLTLMEKYHVSAQIGAHAAASRGSDEPAAS